MQVRYEVEWCIHLPVDEAGNSDYDKAQYDIAYFDGDDSYLRAKRFARKVAHKSVDKLAQIRKQTSCRYTEEVGFGWTEWETDYNKTEEITA